MVVLYIVGLYAQCLFVENLSLLQELFRVRQNENSLNNTYLDMESSVVVKLPITSIKKVSIVYMCQTDSDFRQFQMRRLPERASVEPHLNFRKF